ncbi:FtsX-like permease family protein [Streptomyces milbemycinicus]|uniref:FtsX-like permease family protein n=1 Tax=Streptomyces milbemycinicus TaxID=476552 RepID=A0ABW8LII7_9ACTN
MLTVVAALGVFNTVVLNTRDRRRDLGMLKSIGMTPRQERPDPGAARGAADDRGGAAQRVAPCHTKRGGSRPDRNRTGAAA